MGNKKTVTLSVDPNLWEYAKDKLPGSRSEFFESQLKLYLNYDEDPESKLIDKIMKTKNELNVMEDKLCQIRKEKKIRLKSESVFDEAMISLNRIHSNLGAVGRNQIRNIARRYDVPSLDLENHCISKGLNVVNFMEVPKK